MTCIVGVQTEDGVWIGGDSASIANWIVELTGRSKVFRVGEFLIGSSGSPRVSGLIQHAFTPPPVPDDPDTLDRYMVTEFVPALRTALAGGGTEKKDSEVVEMPDSAFLIGVRGRLLEVHADYQVTYNQPGYGAVGCGWAVALGALHALSRSAPPHKPRELVLAALEAAQAHNIGVRGPFVIEQL